MSRLRSTLPILRQAPLRRTAGLAAVGLGAMMVLAGCSSFTPIDAPAHADRPLPQPEWRAYRIQVDDVLEVSFWGDSELDRTVSVRPDGMISLPYVDDVRAAGLTPAELDAELTRRYAPELRSPQLTVIVDGAGGQQVYIGGEVGGTGSLHLTQNMTLAQAIQEAGGISSSSRIGDVLLIRTMPDGERIARSVDLRPVFSGADPSRDVLLQGNDFIYIPRTKIANVALWIDEYLNSILPIDAVLTAAIYREIFDNDASAAAADIGDDLFDDDDTGDDDTGGDIPIDDDPIDDDPDDVVDPEGGR